MATSSEMAWVVVLLQGNNHLRILIIEDDQAHVTREYFRNSGIV